MDFHENPSSGSRVPCGRTDDEDASSLRDFSNAPIKWDPWRSMKNMNISGHCTQFGLDVMVISVSKEHIHSCWRFTPKLAVACLCSFERLASTYQTTRFPNPEDRERDWDWAKVLYFKVTPRWWWWSLSTPRPSPSGSPYIVVIISPLP
jgi:hypothetical protein